MAIAWLYVQEIYSLIESFTLIIQMSRSVSTITATFAVQQLIDLLNRDLNTTKPLVLHEPSHYVKPAVAKGEEPPPKVARTTKEHKELTEMGKATRVAAHRTVFKRFGQKR